VRRARTRGHVYETHKICSPHGFCLIASLLTGCGGGGGGSPTPRTVANTSSTHYLPLVEGDTWTFASGARIVDEGPLTLSCSCPDNGGLIEEMELFSPSATLLGTIFFASYTPSSGASLLTTLIGTEEPGATTATIASTTQMPYGPPIMDDHPTVGESWSDGLGDTSTITAVNGTIGISNNQEVIDVATDSVVSGSTSFSWSFAKGVGFAAIAEGGSSTNLSSFSLTTAASAGVTTTSVIRGVITSTPPDLRTLTAALIHTSER